jgi:hypothetical protein
MTLLYISLTKQPTQAPKLAFYTLLTIRGTGVKLL